MRGKPDFLYLLTPYCLHLFTVFPFVFCVYCCLFPICTVHKISILYILEYTNKDYCHLVNEQQPEYCVAAKTDIDGRMIKEIRDCKTKFPALCSGSEVADVNTKQSSIHGEFSSVWSRLC